MGHKSASINLGTTLVAFGVFGTMWIMQSRAATYAASAEVESGIVAGKAKALSSSSASKGASIQFGAQAAQNSIGSIDTAVSAFMSTYHIPGMSIAVSRQDKLVYAKSYGIKGGADTSAVVNDSRFRLASVTKPITSVGIHKLIEAGKLSPDQRVFGPGGILGADYPSVPAVNNTITLRNLLTHTTGVWTNDGNDPTYQHPEYTTPQLINWTLSTYPADHNRGKYAYSNFGYLLLGRVIEKVTGQPYRQYITNTVLAPMGINDMEIGGNTLAARKPGEVVYTGQNGTNPYANIDMNRRDANGGWIATATDLARFLAHVDGYGSVPDVLQPATITAMTTPPSGSPNYANGWSVNTSNNWWHNGAFPGTATEIIRSSNGFNWVMFCNSRSYTTGFDTAFDSLLWPAIRDATTPWQNIDQF